MNKLARILCGLGLLAAVAFCCYGFLSAYELEEGDRLPWHIGYGILGVACLAGAIHLFRIRRDK